jgi:BlaI family penicillinase repressor
MCRRESGREVAMKALSEAEWNIMESLWEESPKVGSRIVADMAGRVGWSRSTTLTMLKRMTEKGLIACEDNGRMRVYVPLIERETAVKKETDNFLKRVYHGSASMLVSSFIKKQRLTTEELSELRQILDRAEEDQNG